MLSFFKTDHIPDHTDDVDDVIKKMDTIDEVDFFCYTFAKDGGCCSLE